MINETGGDLSRVEQKLGLFPDQLNNADTMIIYIAPGELKTLHVPDGNELGANEFWVLGGRTSGGVPEATIDVPPGTAFAEIHLGAGS